ncbi:MAG: prepilin-type N-terminal cleavage/methylation domain-containing protein [Planctomycetota bacterium]|nr:prepilin-type N-terminal cleavage/methylation domain-containing protein [Planctomycetota bacterium]
MKTQSGFTLMEIMVVLVIIGILSAAFYPAVSGLPEKAKVNEAKSRLMAISAAIESYRTTEGEYPTDYLPNGLAVNSINNRSEALFLALFNAEYTGQRPSEEWLVNTDNDEATRNLTMLGNRSLFEIGDGWGNPIAYFDSLHYGDRRATIIMRDIEYGDEDEVVPHRNAKTDSYSAPNSFQLVSAGSDGEFGTDDDIYSFSN